MPDTVKIKAIDAMLLGEDEIMLSKTKCKRGWSLKGT